MKIENNNIILENIDGDEKTLHRFLLIYCNLLLLIISLILNINYVKD